MGVSIVRGLSGFDPFATGGTFLAPVQNTGQPLFLAAKTSKYGPRYDSEKSRLGARYKTAAKRLASTRK